MAFFKVTCTTFWSFGCSKVFFRSSDTLQKLRFCTSVHRSVQLQISIIAIWIELICFSNCCVFLIFNPKTIKSCKFVISILRPFNFDLLTWFWRFSCNFNPPTSVDPHIIGYVSFFSLGFLASSPPPPSYPPSLPSSSICRRCCLSFSQSIAYSM